MLIFTHAAAIFLLFMPMVLRIDSVKHTATSSGDEPKTGEAGGADEESKLSEGNVNQTGTAKADQKGEDHLSKHQQHPGNKGKGIASLETSPDQQHVGVQSKHPEDHWPDHHHENEEERIDQQELHQQHRHNQAIGGENNAEHQQEQHQEDHEKRMAQIFLKDTFFPPGVFDGIEKNDFGSYWTNVVDPIIDGDHNWMLAENGNKYHQLPNGDIYMQDVHGQNWIVGRNGHDVNVPLNGRPLPPYTGPFLQRPPLDIEIPAEPPLGMIHHKNIFDGVEPNEEGYYKKEMEDGHIYEFNDGTVYCQEPDGGGLFYKELNDGKIFYQTPDQMHYLFMYLQVGNVPVNVPAAAEDGQFTSAVDGQRNGVKWSKIWIPQKPSLEYIYPRKIFDDVEMNGRVYYSKVIEDGHIYIKKGMKELDDFYWMAFIQEPEGELFFCDLSNDNTFYRSADLMHYFAYKPNGRVEYCTRDELMRSSGSNRDPESPREHMSLPDLTDPFFPPWVFDGIEPNGLGNYVASMPDPILGREHIWELEKDGNKYHQLPNGDIYMQDVHGQNWSLKMSGWSEDVPLNGPLPPYTGPFLQRLPLDIKIPAEPPLGMIHHKNIFDGVEPNKEGSYKKEDGHIYEFNDGIVYCQEPDGGGLFYKELNDGKIFYQTPDQMHYLFMYLQVGNVPVNVPAAAEDGHFTSADDGQRNGVKWSKIWIPQKPSLEDLCPKNVFDGVPAEKGGMQMTEDGHIYEKTNAAAYHQEPDGGLFIKHLVKNGYTFYLTPGKEHIFIYLSKGKVKYVNRFEHLNNPSALDDPEFTKELAWLLFIPGHHGQKENEKPGEEVRTTEINEHGTPPKEDASAAHQHAGEQHGHAGEGDKKKGEGPFKKPVPIEINKKEAGSTRSGAHEKKTSQPSSPGSSRDPESPRKAKDGSPKKTRTGRGHRSPPSRSPPAPGKPSAAHPSHPAGGVMNQGETIDEEHEKPTEI